MVEYKVSSVVSVANDKRREVICNDDDNLFELVKMYFIYEWKIKENTVMKSLHLDTFRDELLFLNNVLLMIP